ncbi:Copper metallochaperone PCu(A)C, inserts Cu(I) into cytochrome oxidase subunit II [hydrothermal vent metagenome]|uniref:Copper metallochaperone PCu(A)C, inserts Cu(I) into cytochrome oxidase subunit II n=1 Tax=hydrothermal vent metagenome TaxID=652676 RepID=A0A3B0RET6_9ZZZZ
MFAEFTLTAGLVALFAVAPAFAQDITIVDAYARSSSPMAKTGAAYLVIENHTDNDDRLLDVASPAAKRVELHTNVDNGQGVMSMQQMKEGLALPDGGTITMQRGGEHVMFMGLTGPFEQGATIPLTLTFEKAGEMEIDIPVDLERKP